MKGIRIVLGYAEITSLNKDGRLTHGHMVRRSILNFGASRAYATWSQAI